MTEKIEINRKTIYLTIDNVRFESENGIEEQDNQFVAFIKNTPPTEIFFGELLKDENDETIIYESYDDARKNIINRFAKEIYPPNFLNPLEYNKENLSEIMHKILVYDLGKSNSDNIDESIEGVMTECSLAANHPYLPSSATIVDIKNAKKTISFFEIKGIRKV